MEGIMFNKTFYSLVAILTVRLQANTYPGTTSLFIAAFSITTLSILGLHVTLSINHTQHK
jgi:hypothetical protein